MTMNESINLESPEDRLKIVDTLNIDIDTWCEGKYGSENRNHLGASVIGRPCARQLWYIFRWAKKPVFGEGTKRTAGQILRLFNRGHREEISIIEYLEGIGCRFEAPQDQQIKINDVAGHFGGSLDNVGYLPDRYGIPYEFLFEFKTSNSTDFAKLQKSTVKLEKPEHWAQMCVYGYKTNHDWAVYIVVEKQTDALHIEILKLDHELGKSQIDKAAMIISSQTAPPKLYQTAVNFTCKFCQFVKICHEGDGVEKNCRSCVHCFPTEGAKWCCALAPIDSNVIPEDFIKVGCDQHKGIA